MRRNRRARSRARARAEQPARWGSYDPAGSTAGIERLSQGHEPIGIRFAETGDGQALAKLRWLTRDPGERAAQWAEAFEGDFVDWFAVALASGRWRIAVAVAAVAPG